MLPPAWSPAASLISRSAHSAATLARLERPCSRHPLQTRKSQLFFKWIKQHLRIKAFYGTSANAVKTQIWIAVIVYLLVAIVKKRLHLPGSLHTLLQIMEVNLFEKTDIIQVVEKAMRQETMPEPGNQLNLFSS